MPAITDAFMSSARASERVARLRAVLDEYGESESVLPAKIRQCLRRWDRQEKLPVLRATTDLTQKLKQLEGELEDLHAHGDFSSPRHAAVAEAIVLTRQGLEAAVHRAGDDQGHLNAEGEDCLMTLQRGYADSTITGDLVLKYADCGREFWFTASEAISVTNRVVESPRRASKRTEEVV